MGSLAEQAKENIILNGSKDGLFSRKMLENTPLEDLLTILIRILKAEISQATEHIIALEKENELILLVIEMINAAEIIQMNFQLVLEVLKSNSSEEFEKIKNKFPLIKDNYSKVASKEDFSRVPANYVLGIYYEKLIVEFQELNKQYISKGYFGEVYLVEHPDLVAKIKILTQRLKISSKPFSMVMIFPKDDIFTHPRNSFLWKELENSVTYKSFLNKEEIQKTYKPFHLVIFLGHVIIRKQIQDKDLDKLKAMSRLLSEIAYYQVNSSKLEIQAFLFLIDAKLDETFRAWNLVEHPVISKFMQIKVPHIGYDQVLHLPRDFPRITRERVLQEYAENTYNKIHPFSREEMFTTSTLYEEKSAIIDSLFRKGADRVSVRLLAPHHLKFKSKRPSLYYSTKHALSRAVSGPGNKTSGSQDIERAIIVHIHGGGFVSQSSASHRLYLNKMVKNLNLMHFCIDYRLAPENMYPDALDDVWQAYLWIYHYAETILGIKGQKVILLGDSAGANLVLAGLPIPDSCILIYPAVYVDAYSYSPSYLTSVDDPILPTNLLRSIARAYVPEGFKNREDPCISPLVASDELLEKLPPVRIIACTADPLVDDNWRFYHRLRQLKKDVKMSMHRDMPHGYLCHGELKNYDWYVKEICDNVQELIEEEGRQDFI